MTNLSILGDEMMLYDDMRWVWEWVLKKFWFQTNSVTDVGEDLEKGFWNETIKFWKIEPLRALKDKGIRIIEKGIRIAYEIFWDFRLYAKGFESLKKEFESLEDVLATGNWIRILERGIRIA